MLLPVGGFQPPRNAERREEVRGENGAAVTVVAQIEPAAAAPPGAGQGRGVSNVEQAVIGHGDDMGTFIEMNGLKLERDDRFPVRVTVQFYKATSNGVVSDQDLADAAKQIDKVYGSADSVGSLVVDADAHTRPTDWKRGRTPRVAVAPRFWKDLWGG